MNVCLRPTGLHSRAMLRVAEALTAYAPSNVTVVKEPADADFQIVHVIGTGSFEGVDESKPHAIIQYCLKSSGRTEAEWLPTWRKANLVWSYFHLLGEFHSMHAPLGVDPIFTLSRRPQPRLIGVMTSGYVSGPASEAIDEVAEAASRVGAYVAHLGPPDVEGMASRTRNWRSIHEINDANLADLYNRTRWVSGLRHVEGFELPVLEGLVCGARPIVFDRPDMRDWYDGHAVFVPECCGEELVDRLMPILASEPKPVDAAERKVILKRFNWSRIATQFWEELNA